MEIIPKHNFKESLISSKNHNTLESIQLNQQNKIEYNDVDINNIYIKYNQLKNKINLFWNKIE